MRVLSQNISVYQQVPVMRRLNDFTEMEQASFARF